MTLHWFYARVGCAFSPLDTALLAVVKSPKAYYIKRTKTKGTFI